MKQIEEIVQQLNNRVAELKLVETEDVAQEMIISDEIDRTEAILGEIITNGVNNIDNDLIVQNTSLKLQNDVLENKVALLTLLSTNEIMRDDLVFDYNNALNKLNLFHSIITI